MEIVRRLSTSHAQSPIEVLDKDNKQEIVKTKTYVSDKQDELSTTVILFTITLVSFFSRFFNLSHPKEVVFDEVHYGKMINSYLKGEYFYNVFPPLGTLLYFLVSLLVGYRGNNSFSHIGCSYVDDGFDMIYRGGMEYLGLRCLPACCGSLLVSVVFLILKEIGLSTHVALCCVSFLLFDNSLITISQYILPDAIYIFFTFCSFYCYIRYKTKKSWKWLLMTGVSMALPVLVKFSGIYTLVLISLSSLKDIFVNRRNKTTSYKHVLMFLIGVPLLMYISVYYVHFSILDKDESRYSLMNEELGQSPDQEELIGKHHMSAGDIILIKNELEDIYLHSHKHLYPLRHQDGTISSNGQQVSGYPEANDPNNFWIIEKGDDHDNSERYDGIIKDNDIVTLIHVETQNYLYCHDVASPVTKTHMEITAASEEELDKEDSLKSPANIFWRVNKVDPSTPEIQYGERIILTHVDTGVTLNNQQQNYQDWGFRQREINGDKKGAGFSIVWKCIQKDNHYTGYESVPHEKDGFIRRFVENHYFIFRSFRDHFYSDIEHPYSSNPLSWPFLVKGVSFWDKMRSSEQVYIIGNPFSWFSAIILFGISVALFLKKCLSSYFQDKGQLFCYSGFFLQAWAFHYLPFVLGIGLSGCGIKHGYFYFYIPSFIFSVINIGIFMEEIQGRNEKIQRLCKIIFACLVAGNLFCFLRFACMTYGFQTSTEMGQSLRWLPTWDFLVTLHPK